jgi:hypothetical protein
MKFARLAFPLIFLALTTQAEPGPVPRRSCGCLHYHPRQARNQEMLRGRGGIWAL